jgi:peptidoglycan/xylan/chitin deacetylase (PgdA/CDA1 family)
MSASTLVASFGYHDVTDDPTESGFQRKAALPFKLGSGLFLEHLDRIGSASVVPARVDTIDLTRPGRHLLLTFDDGGKSAIRIADELSRRDWKGHFFITTSLIGGRTFLNRAEIRQLQQAGHLVGSHSHSHPNIYRELDRDRMVVEWRQSCDILEQVVGEPCLTAAVPGGEISSAVLRSAGAAGLRYLFTSEPMLVPRVVMGCWVLGRFCPKSSTSTDEIGDLAAFRGWAARRMLRRMKALARRSVPPLYRLYVSRTTREWQGTTP